MVVVVVDELMVVVGLFCPGAVALPCLVVEVRLVVVGLFWPGAVSLPRLVVVVSFVVLVVVELAETGGIVMGVLLKFNFWMRWLPPSVT